MRVQLNFTVFMMSIFLFSQFAYSTHEDPDSEELGETNLGLESQNNTDQSDDRSPINKYCTKKRFVTTCCILSTLGVLGGVSYGIFVWVDDDKDISQTPSSFPSLVESSSPSLSPDVSKSLYPSVSPSNDLTLSPTYLPSIKDSFTETFPPTYDQTTEPTPSSAPFAS